MSQCRPRPARWSIALLVATLWGGDRLAAEGESAPPPTPVQEQPEVLSRGPVHEAFAEPVSMQLQAGLIAPDRPPPTSRKSRRRRGPRPAVRLDPGVLVVGRGPERLHLGQRLLASGSAENVLGARVLVSGGRRMEWVAGFWAPAGAREIEYLPAPPTVDDVEPLGPAPSPDTIWVPPACTGPKASTPGGPATGWRRSRTGCGCRLTTS